MTDSLATRSSLIARVRNTDDQDAWSEFTRLYEPLIRRVLRKSGLSRDDTDDVTQDVLHTVARTVGGLQIRAGGGFRKWLFTVTKSRVADHFRKTRPRDRGTGDTAVKEQLADVPAPLVEAEWDREYEREVLQWAAERVTGEFRANTWQAFHLTAIEGVAGPEAARQLGLSLGAVHIARSRVLARLREVTRELLAE
jgi:RNA polymerase sigma-70 factor (ECF subfamily)